MIQLSQAQFTPHQNCGRTDTEHDMNALARRYNEETRSQLAAAGLSKHKTFIVRRPANSYLPILN